MLYRAGREGGNFYVGQEGEGVIFWYVEVNF